MGMMIFEFANTYVGKPGNIGVRTAKILNVLSAQNKSATCICRGAVICESNVTYISMGLLGHIPRLLNAVRIYLFRGFNHRPLDINIFERFSKWHLGSLLKTDRSAVAHVWDVCPRLIRKLKAEGMRVLLDVPIAPQTYSQRMNRSGQAPFLLDDQQLIDIELTAFSEADLLIAPSQFVADELVLAGVARERIVVIEFGAEIPTMPEEEGEENRKLKDRLDFCIVGALGPRKGVLELLEAWSDPAFDQDRLHLCGRVFPGVASRISACGSDNILTPGFIKPAEYFQHCDVFVLPSWLEGSAKAVYEAMASGLPAIVTASTGSIVRDGIDGFVIEPGDVSALRERMLWFKAHPEKIQEMGANARKRVSEFTWERYAQRVIDLYAEYA